MNDLQVLRPPFSSSAEVGAMYKWFIALEEGEKLSYVQTREIIGIKPQTERGRSITSSAREKVQREHQIVIRCIRNEGFQRVTDPGKLDLADSQIKKVRRAVKRGGRIVKAIKPEKFDNPDRVRYTLIVSWQGALNQVTRPVMAKRILKVLDQSSEINCGDVLQLATRK